MKMVKSLLLGMAVGMIVMSGAQALNLPVKGDRPVTKAFHSWHMTLAVRSHKGWWVPIPMARPKLEHAFELYRFKRPPPLILADGGTVLNPTKG